MDLKTILIIIFSVLGALIFLWFVGPYILSGYHQSRMLDYMEK